MCSGILAKCFKAPVWKTVLWQAGYTLDSTIRSQAVDLNIHPCEYSETFFYMKGIGGFDIIHCHVCSSSFPVTAVLRDVLEESFSGFLSGYVSSPRKQDNTHNEILNIK